MNGTSIVATNLRWLHKNTLLASVDLEVPAWRLKFNGSLWHRKGNKEWIAFASREWLDKNGTRQFDDLVQFTDRVVHERFQQAALAAVHRIAELDQQRGAA